jgi:hypothetical protein
VGWGEVGLSPNDWVARDGGIRIGAREVLAMLIVIGVLLVIGAVFYIYGPLPRIFPSDCPGCFFSRP